LREEWLDTAGLRREVLDPLGPDGTGRYLPTLWDADLDRATRAAYAAAPAGAVLLLDGALLLGRGLPVDHSVHVRLSMPALARRTLPEERWTVPAYARYDAEVEPERTADVVIRLDDPRHPAVTFRPGPHWSGGPCWSGTGQTDQPDQTESSQSSTRRRAIDTGGGRAANPSRRRI
jgi:hypothetical protein